MHSGIIIASGESATGPILILNEGNQLKTMLVQYNTHITCCNAPLFSKVKYDASKIFQTQKFDVPVFNTTTMCVTMFFILNLNLIAILLQQK